MYTIYRHIFCSTLLTVICLHSLYCAEIIPDRSLQALKQEVEHFAVNAHRAVAVHQMLSASFAPSRAGELLPVLYCSLYECLSCGC